MCLRWETVYCTTQNSICNFAWRSVQYSTPFSLARYSTRHTWMQYAFRFVNHFSRYSTVRMVAQFTLNAYIWKISGIVQNYFTVLTKNDYRARPFLYSTLCSSRTSVNKMESRHRSPCATPVVHPEHRPHSTFQLLAITLWLFDSYSLFYTAPLFSC